MSADAPTLTARPAPPAPPVLVGEVLPQYPVRHFPGDGALRRQLMPPGARRHPGKLHLGFLSYLRTWAGQVGLATAGMTWLDPLAGPGSLLYLTQQPWGDNVILNELEEHWASWARASWAWLRDGSFYTRGTAAIYQGDARTLTARLRGRDGMDGLCCSPPYGDAIHPGSWGPSLKRLFALNPRWGRPERSLLGGQNYTMDGLLTSPPYSHALSHQRHGEDYDITEHSRAASVRMRMGYDGQPGAKPTPGVRNPAQIGNLRGARYAAAMQEVYAACVPLVRAGGPIIVVLKNPVEHNREVDLIGQVRGQLEALGCRYVTTHWRYVRPAAFHNLRRKANPDALIVTREAALVLTAPTTRPRWGDSP